MRDLSKKKAVYEQILQMSKKVFIVFLLFGCALQLGNAEDTYAESPGLMTVTAPSGPAAETTSAVFVPVPDMTGALVTAEGSSMRITFTAEAYTLGSERMFVRALVDGQVAAPSDVLFAVGTEVSTQSFTFVAENLVPGLHTVSIEWSVDPNGTAFVGDRTLAVLASPPTTTNTGLFVVAAPSGPDVSTMSAGFSTVPHMNTTVVSTQNSNIEIAFSAEASSTTPQRVFVRALVDGQPASPSDIVFVAGPDTGTRSFVFTQSGAAAGMHTVEMQWLVDSGGTAFMGDRTLAVFASPASTVDGGLVVISPASGPDVTTMSSSFSDVPGMSASVTTADDSLLQITFSAEALTLGSGRMFVRALVDGQPARPSDMVFATGSTDGSNAFSFSAEGIPHGNHTVQIQYSVDSGDTAALGDRTLSLVSLPRQIVYSLPGGDNHYVYPVPAVAELTDDPGQSKPVAVGAVAMGGNLLEIQVRLPYFEAPVDVYFGIFAPMINPDYLILQPDYSLLPAMQSLVPWKTGIVTPLDEAIFGQIPTIVLPSGTYDLALLVVPMGSGFADYYLWFTSFEIP